MSCFTDSLSFHIAKSLAHARADTKEIIYIAKLQIVTIHDNNELIRKKFKQAANKTIMRKDKFTYQTWRYQEINSLSSCVKDKSNLILFFTNGAKNITPEIAESLASDEMMFFSVSIINN